MGPARTDAPQSLGIGGDETAPEWGQDCVLKYRPARLTSYVRFIIEGGVAGAWAKLGGLGATSANLIHVMDLSAAQNMEAASRYEKSQISAWAHLRREGGNADAIRDELDRLSRDRLGQ